MTFCTNCGRKNPDSARFCDICGVRIADALVRENTFQAQPSCRPYAGSDYPQQTAHQETSVQSSTQPNLQTPQPTRSQNEPVSGPQQSIQGVTLSTAPAVKKSSAAETFWWIIGLIMIGSFLTIIADAATWSSGGDGFLGFLDLVILWAIFLGTLVVYLLAKRFPSLSKDMPF